MSAGPEVILHHYDPSLFSEKVRRVFGAKGLSWQSVVISSTMPRPDLMPLTGGYRRTPVMQIGADVYCDTQVIVRELERRFPQPTLFPAGSEGAAWLLASVADRALFQASVGVVFGSLPDGALPAEFIKDREQLSGRPFDPAALRSAAPHARDQWLAYADWVEAQLRGQELRGQSFLLGEAPGYADLALSMDFWFVTQAGRGGGVLLQSTPHTRAWLERLAALGHGQRSEMTSARALEIARAATPAAPLPSSPDALGARRLGERVAVTPDDYGRIPVVGELVSIGEQHVSLRRHDDRAGEVVVHFPRAGFVVGAAP